MRRRTATAAVLAGLMLGASGVPAQQDPTTAKTTDTYDADSTSEDIRKSCKELTAKATAVGAVTVVGECNKANSDGDVSAVSTIINMSNLAGCHKTRGRGYRVDWGTGSSSATMFDGFILLTIRLQDRSGTGVQPRSGRVTYRGIQDGKRDRLSGIGAGAYKVKSFEPGVRLDIEKYADDCDSDRGFFEEDPVRLRRRGE